MSSRSLFVSIVILLSLAIASNVLYIVKETERGVLLRFGEVVDADLKPGIHVKMPVMHQVRKFDARVLTLDYTPQSYLTQDKKPLIVDSFVKWRIKDVSKFYTATSGDEIAASRLLASRVDDGLRKQFAQRTVHEVISGQRDELMDDLTVKLNQVVLTDIGVELLDIRVKGIELPERVNEDVYKRMRSEREREAREYRSRGRELAEGIRADADRRRTIIEANAYREAEKIRGDGDAQSARIYAEAFSKDPEFYSFVRSLKAYQETFSADSDVMILDSDSDFFKYLGAPKTKQ
ncbi:protease modulator HflC [Litoribrevibacter albus]|uniref:Protein HflC n=1 Tax=Litoribrevibacter albus TaxID=1473156 RepID=A0AA37S7N4_9GAMM|nr:protease modulator HflC [Litoribrevibacter albus]GLQ30637.1 protein HflC [Litoribrevibacter albus]